MFKFTKQQLEQVAGSSEAMLVQAIRSLARQQHPYLLQDLPQDLFDGILASSLKTARGYGLQSPADLAAFVLLQFEMGPEFHRHPTIHAVLADPARGPKDKLDAIFEEVPPAAWSEVESQLHRQSWFPESRVAMEP